MSADTEVPRLGEGIYTFAEAARIIRNAVDPVSPATLRSWVHSGLVSADRYDPTLDRDVLTFDDLVSLEVVRRLRRHGPRRTSLQKIRQVESRLREDYELHRPFAWQIFYTDGASVWAKIAGPYGAVDTIEVHGKRANHYVWAEAIATFAEQIAFDEYGRAAAWRPTQWVEINPRVQFGTPVVSGTRVPVSVIDAQLEAGSVAEVARWYGLEVRQVEGVRQYLALGA